MTLPPQPGQWGPGNQPPGPPPSYYPPQGGWGNPPPPKPNNTIKWLLAGIGVLLVIAITVGVTVLVTRDGSGGAGPSTTTSASGPPIASADDTGPVEIITLEPTCQAWAPLSSAMSQVQKNGWADRDPSIPATNWTNEQRAQHEAVAKSMRETADQAVGFARQTPHRLMREIYEQFVFYARAYADSIPTYSPSDDYLSLANIAASYVIDAVCDSITYGSAAARAASVTPIDPPAEIGSPNDPENPKRVVSAPSASCTDLVDRRERLIADTDKWTDEDPNIPESDWSAQRRSLANSTAQSMAGFANDLESVGKGSGDSTFEDIASFGALYVRAYVNALPTYVAADSYLLMAGTRANNVLITACQAVSE